MIVISCSFIISRYKIAGTFKNTREFKTSIEGANLHPTFIIFVKIRPVNVFLWEKNRIRESDDKLCGMRDSLEKGAGMRDQGPPPPCQTL